MRVQTIDRRIAKLLNDPLTSLIIQADGVDRARLAAQLRRVAEPRRVETLVRRNDDRQRGVLARLSADLFGACAP